MKEEKEFQTNPTSGVKVLGGIKSPEAGEGVKIVGGAPRPDTITTMDKHPEKK
jgi:hypothetical protein